jgi:uridine kinase
MGTMRVMHMKTICLHPLFVLGLAVRLILLVVMAPTAVNDWYVPFLESSTAQFTLDPWAAWTNSGGTPMAFPYGYAMWLVLLPITLLAKFFSIPYTLGYGLTLLSVDTSLLMLLRYFLPKRDRLLLGVYWLSPIVILATYGFGLNDLVPVFFLTFALYLSKRLKHLWAGIALIAAISAKFSMVMALPFFLIYLFNNRTLRQALSKFIAGMFCGGAFLILPFLFSSVGLQMLFSNPEMGKVYRAAISLGSNVHIYAVPFIYLVVLYMVWRIRRLNFDLFNATLGTAFLLLVLLTPSSPGWFIWALPILVIYQATSGRIAIALTSIFSSLYVISTLLTTPLHFQVSDFLYFVNLLKLSESNGNPAYSLLHTVMVATGVVLAIRIWRETVNRNDFFRLSRKPFVIGIAGDSGAGKDTFSDAVRGLFGESSVVTLSGDDYHLWDRQKPMWQVLTALNPKANDLDSFSNDLVALVDGKSIYTHHYDHKTGKMTMPFLKKSNDFILVSGLHALYLPTLRGCYNLSIYLDIDEELRRYFKIKRDMGQRGHSLEQVMASFERREPDAVRFIRPQAGFADLIFSLQPIHQRVLTNCDDKEPLRFKLVARTRHGLNEVELIRVLVGVCGLHVDMEVNKNGSEVILTIEGDTSPEDIAMAAKMLCPRIFEFLDMNPVWEDGILGLMQLVTLSHINQALTKRFVQ